MGRISVTYQREGMLYAMGKGKRSCGSGHIPRLRGSYKCASAALCAPRSFLVREAQGFSVDLNAADLRIIHYGSELYRDLPAGHENRERLIDRNIRSPRLCYDIEIREHLMAVDAYV